MEQDIAQLRREIKLALMRAGIRCDLVGFSYLCYAVELVLQEPDLINSLCKELYVKISEKFDVKKDNCIERSIRHAIEQTSNSKTFSGLNKMFGMELYTDTQKPTSGELIRLISEYIKLGLYNNVA